MHERLWNYVTIMRSNQFYLMVLVFDCSCKLRPTLSELPQFIYESIQYKLVNDVAVNELTRPFDDDHFINMANLTIFGLQK